MSTDWNEFLNGNFMENEDDPFDGSDDEDRDYEPETETDDDYDSDDDFIEEAFREEMALEENRKYMSKDGTIQYSSQPLQARGRPFANAMRKDVGLALIKPFIQIRTVLPRGQNALSVIKRMRGEISELHKDVQDEAEASTSTSGITKTAPGKRKRCHMCPPKRSTNVHSTRCDKCHEAICSAHYYKLCDDCITSFL